MHRIRPAIGSLIFLVIAPGAVVGLFPWLITGWQAGTARPAALVAIGAVVTAVGCGTLLQAYGQFVVEGLGTPAPPAPTQELVTRGLYRHVRNPMYLAVLAGILGQVLILDRPVLLIYAAAVATGFVAFVRLYEEPTLTRKYGRQYLDYRQQVPRWLPDLHSRANQPRAQ
jgi:protein-S-isoprenylcysteine O-methyltransferase Ste14